MASLDDATQQSEGVCWNMPGTRQIKISCVQSVLFKSAHDEKFTACLLIMLPHPQC